jgi:hypothetical protein
MSLTSTTIAAALNATERIFHVTSATGFDVGDYVRINDEFVKIQEILSTKITAQRGRWGTNARAHGILSIAVVGAPEDWAPRPAKHIYTYGAAGAVTPAPGLHRFIAASAAAMTLAAPTADMEGEEFTFIAAAAQAYTLTLDSGYFNGATNNIGTWAGAIGDVITCVVVGGSYCVVTNKNITLSA